MCAFSAFVVNGLALVSGSSLPRCIESEVIAAFGTVLLDSGSLVILSLDYFSEPFLALR